MFNKHNFFFGILAVLVITVLSAMYMFSQTVSTSHDINALNPAASTDSLKTRSDSVQFVHPSEEATNTSVGGQQ